MRDDGYTIYHSPPLRRSTMSHGQSPRLPLLLTARDWFSAGNDGQAVQYYTVVGSRMELEARTQPWLNEGLPLSPTTSTTGNGRFTRITTTCTAPEPRVQ